MQFPSMDWLRKLVASPISATDEQATDSMRRASLHSAPVFWLLGKTGSGKTSIIASLTGSTTAEVGNGYASCTKSAMAYDFPLDQPLIRFLDTRGLGEAGYDPTDDMAVNAKQAHLIFATMRAADMNQGELVQALTLVRKEHPAWPIVVAQTCLHELYVPRGGDHPADYAFLGNPEWRSGAVPASLSAALARQRTMLNALKGDKPTFVPIDFTLPTDGFTQTEYGRDALIEAVLQVSPRAMKALAKLHFEEALSGPMAQLSTLANKTALYYAAAAAGVGAIPVAGMFTVPAANAAMLWTLARQYEVSWDRKSVASLVGMLGAAVAFRETALLGLRHFMTALPWLIPVAAVQDYAVTYALGRAASTFMAARKANVEPDAEEVRRAFSEGLKEAFRRRRDLGDR